MARWVDLAPRQENTPNRGGGMVEHRGVVLHIAEGSYEGTIAWQKNPDSQVSSHFIAAKNGRAAQMVDTEITAWTQRDGNGHWLSIENEGFVPNALTGAQVEFAAQILARAHTEYDVPLQVTSDPNGRGLGHHSMGAPAWGHSQCPGSSIINQKGAIVARAKEIIEEASMPTAEEIAKAVWDRDQIPAPKPPNNDPDFETNPTWQADNALCRAVEKSTEAARLAGQILQDMGDGVPVVLTAEQLDELAANVANRLRALVFKAEG